MTNNNPRETPRPQRVWGYYNNGNLWGIAHTRRDAIKEVETITGDPWAKAKRYMEIHRVIVTKEPRHD
ncbi:hypothetical protein [Vulcaniibacterium tengchongense]|uniref:Uncharacterized protein n=1 Tax=Vulcaniibacterium tengchongense TaxID=1273429 RepID=A0A3N4V0I8_9GAMM|nr:hypothetical protein [Vulcaniibacterium tengchongense]RPE74655.1 hypothetical protein EDC50_3184 [Vulcaniibacterium tengchongense]